VRRDGAEIDDVMYYINVSGSVVKLTTFSHDHVTCPVEFTLTDDSDVAFTDGFVTFDNSNGQITMLTTDFATYDKTIFTLRLKYTSINSSHANRQHVEEFVVTVQDQCRDTIVTAASFTIPVSLSYTYDVWDTQAMPFNAASESVGSDACGTWAYTVVGDYAPDTDILSALEVTG